MRKQILMSMLLATACGATSFATDVVTILPDHSFYMLPAEIANDGKAFIYDYSREDGETNTTRFYIYDEDFQLAKEFVTIPGTPNGYSYQIQGRENIPVSATIHYEDQRSEILEINGASEGLTIENVVNELNESHHLNSDWEIVTIEDGTEVVANASTYYNESYFGKKYPQYLYKQVNGLWYYFIISYDTQYGPYGEWKEAQTLQSDGEYPYPADIEIIPLDGSDGEYFELTRGIFGYDFCYVLPEYRKVEFKNEYTYENTDWVYRKEWGYRSEINAYKVYDSSNNAVATFEIPEGYIADDDNLDFIRLNGKRYIAIDIKKPGTTEYGFDYFTVIYRLDENNKVSQVAIAPSTKVSPRAPRQGELVTVSFDDESISSPKIIEVVSASGQNVYKTKLPAGQSSINIDTSRLNQGMYVVTVTANGINQEAAKIIVR